MHKHNGLKMLLAVAMVLSATVAFGYDLDSNNTSMPTSSSELQPAGSTKASSSNLLSNKQYEDDHTLTDPALRAQDGSLSRYSFKGSLTYSGAAIGDMSNPNRPNIDGVVRNNATQISGSVTANYRFDAERSLSFGTGVAFNHPFDGMDRTDANNPFVSYNRAVRFGNLELRTSPGLTVSTVPTYTNLGEIGGVNWINGLVYNFMSTRLSVGLDSRFDYWVFSRDYAGGSGVSSSGKPYTYGDAVGGNSQQWDFSYSPKLLFRINDSSNVYTNLYWQAYNPRGNSPDLSILWNAAPTWSTGYGWAYSRDFYISPSITSFLSDIRSDTTTFNVTTYFSLL